MVEDNASDVAEFLLLGRDVDRWIQKAQQQWCVVRVVWNRFDELRNLRRAPEEYELLEKVACFGAVMFHAALAVELSAKAVLIARRPSLVNEKGLEVKNFPGKKGHDLVSLTEEAIGPIDTGKKELLERLIQATLWTGRYPIPTKAKDMELVKSKRQKRLIVPQDLEIVESLCQQLQEVARGQQTDRDK